MIIETILGRTVLTRILWTEALWARILWICAFVLISALVSSHSKSEDLPPPPSKQVIPLFTYHLAEPFIIDPKTELGLTYELARFLTKCSGGRYLFQVNLLSRPELNKQLSQRKLAVIPWVNPAWFADIDQEKILWTAGHLEDSNSLISSPNHPIEYSGPTSLKGLTVAGLEGGKWVGLDPLVKDGAIHRVDTENYWQALRLVLAEKVDVALIPTPVAKYLIARRELTGKLYFSSEYHSRYQRHLMVKGDEEVHAYLQSQIPFLLRSREWKSILARYGQ